MFKGFINHKWNVNTFFNKFGLWSFGSLKNHTTDVTNVKNHGFIGKFFLYGRLPSICAFKTVIPPLARHLKRTKSLFFKQADLYFFLFCSTSSRF